MSTSLYTFARSTICEKSIFAKLKGLGTKTATVRKKVDKKKDSELIEALCPKIDDVASSLCRRNVISEGKEENILCLQGSTIKAQFLMDVLNGKGQGAMTALYEVACNFQLWYAADILEPSNAPHGPRPAVISPTRKSIDDVDGHIVKLPTARKVSFSDEVDNTKHKQAMNVTSLMPEVRDEDRTGSQADEATNATSLVPEGGDEDHIGSPSDEAMNATCLVPEGGDEDHRGSPGVSVKNQCEDSDFESEIDTSPEGQKKVTGDGESKSRLGSKVSTKTVIDEKQNEEHMEKANESKAILKSSAFWEIEEPNAEWTEVGGLETLKERIRESYIETVFMRKFPHLKRDPQKPLRNFLLFGPDTDMKYIARAIAKEADFSCIISVSANDLVSVETNERVMEAVFEYARCRRDCLVLISEIDVLCTSKSQSAEQIRRDFLQQLTPEMTDDDVVIFCATNKPWAVDSDIKRRFRHEVYICAPDLSLRVEIFKEWFHNTQHIALTATDTALEELAIKSDGYSRTQIDAILKATLMAPVRKVQTAVYFRKVRGPSRENPSVIVDDLWTPCTPGAPGAVEMSWMEVPDRKLLEPLITSNDVLHAIYGFKDADEYTHERFERYMDNLETSN